MSLTWLTLFRDFEDAQGTNQGRLALPTFTFLQTGLAIGLCINQWGLGSFLRLVFFSFPFVVPYKHVHPTLAIVSINMSSRLNNFVPHVLANYIHVFIYIHIHSLQTIILQTVLSHFANCVSSFQHWAIKYGLIAHGAEVDLKSFSLVRAHFDGLSSDEVSKDPIFSHYLLLHLSQDSSSNPMCCHKSFGVYVQVFLLLQT